MISLSVNDKAASGRRSGPRPVNLRTDLGALADLIELAFADTMDSSGRAAIREMRALGSMGIARSLVMGLNEMAEGIGLGYVWVEDGQIVGNASIYPAHLPRGAPRTWIIANVAVHPEFRGRRIARALMESCLGAIRARSQTPHPTAILQVVDPNPVALHLYERLGFIADGRFTHWRRSAAARAMPYGDESPPVTITRRRAGEWRAEYALALRARPDAAGGVGWLRPTLPSLFRQSLLSRISDLFSLRSLERLIIRGEGQDSGQIRASLWIESGFTSSSTQLTLLCDPDTSALYGEALLRLATARYRLRANLTLEHPADDDVINALLKQYGFTPQRTLMHMHWHP
ncbi:MAG: GNAT family N-acetyltransferase [Anaerolineae bacterium]|nr:GNAT family N-acetyltransferase [Anaerolineae bacterium]NUQ03349.1 GNAT family N-acetyltransferase [Anaerolineae bacterium]